MIARVLAKTGATVQARGMMYKVVAQSVTIYVINNLVVIGSMLKVLDRFHHRTSRHITGITAISGADGEWEYPPGDDCTGSCGTTPHNEVH